MPGLDGLRALAVIAVLLYHAGLSWIPGGFLGVEVFFVLSGYLITALLLAEWRARGRVELKAFWIRRARRLLPALYVVVVATLAYAVVFLPGEVAGLRTDALAAFGYVTNWYLVFAQESYFEAVGRPSLLKHLWSLAVEEQFYVLWPLLFWVGISFGAKRWRRRRVLALAVGGACASMVLMAAMYVPGTDPSRLYYGTDTRAAGLLAGAALALAWTPRKSRTTGPDSSSSSSSSSSSPSARPSGMPSGIPSGGAAPGRSELATNPQHSGAQHSGAQQSGALGAALSRLRRRWGWTVPMWLDIAGVLALGALVVLCVRVGEFDAFLYRGGLAAVSVATVVVIVALAHPFTRLGSSRVMGCAPLVWIGERSYGIYLWHWPVYMLSRPQLDVPLEGVGLVVVRLGATVVLAELSYRYVEMPVRRGALGRWWRSLREARGFRRWDLGVRTAARVVPVVGVCVALGIAVAHAKPPETPDYLQTKAIHTTEQPSPATSRSAPEERDEAHREPEAAKKPEALEKESAPVRSVSAIGDSVMLGAAARLDKVVEPLSVLDAQVGMQVAGAIDTLEARRYASQTGEVVVVHLGNNGTFTARQFDEIMRVLSDARKVVFVNVKVPRPWEAPNNEVISRGVSRHDKAVLVDWHAASAGHPEYFTEDGIHLQPAGQRAYADLISAEIEPDK